MNFKITTLLLLFCFTYSFSQDTRKADLLKMANEYRDSLGFSGSILVADQNQILLEKSYGYASREHKVLNTNETIYRIASISKVIVSYAIFILADQGKIDFDVPIKKYIPELKEEIASKITIRQIINHNSGLIASIDNIQSKDQHDYFKESELVSYINTTNLQSEPGKNYSYSNVGYTLLGIIIQNVAAKPFNEAMKELVFVPLQMNDTGHEREEEIIENMASGYYYLNGRHYNASHENKSHVFAAGSLYSNPKDLLKFGREVLKGTLLSKKFHEAYVEDIGEYATGGGWITWNYKGNLNKKDETGGRLIMHGGSCPGYRSSFTIFLKDSIVVIGISNQSQFNTSKFLNKFGNIGVGLEKEEVHKPYLNKILPHILNNDFKKARAIYDGAMLKDKDNKITSTEFNRMGYSYLNIGKIKEAILIFRFSVLIYYGNPNLFDSLGEALLSDGQTTEAIKMYKKSLELNPRNEAARIIIEKHDKKKSD